MNYQAMKTNTQWRGDQNTRNRYRQHNRSMQMQGQGARNSEMALAQEKLGRKFTKAESGMWHQYVMGKGDRPGSFGGGLSGMGSGPPGMGGEAPELNLPEYDDREVSKLAQKKAASGVRRLRDVTQRVLSSSHENPNVQKMTVRDALAGYGTGLESVMAGAEQSAGQQYGQQYAASVNAEMARFDAANRKQMQEFDISSKAWLMERQYQLEDQYAQDPYDAFEEFYG